jgi:hypothetical protein
MTTSRTTIWVAALVFGVLSTIVFPSTARAYPWMIRHGYMGCQPCHTDPSGGAGALTPYGRAQGDLLLQMRFGDKGEEANPTSGLLWGQVQGLPEELRLGGDFREAFLAVQPEGAPLSQQIITMRADLYGDIKASRFRAAGSIGYAPTGARAAALTDAPKDNLISREHWVGAELDDDAAWLLRAGRLTLPFGVRMIEHTLWARALSRTDLNATQQYGASLAVSKEHFRAELMGIVGNLQIRPDDFRERGYSGYFEYTPTTNAALGVSSLFTRARVDVVYGVTNYRHAHGIFARYSPIRPLVLLAEADWLYQSLSWHGHRGGYAAFLQADDEPLQGFHLMLTVEAMNGGQVGEPSSYDAWFSGVWFFAPHADMRIDTILSTLGVPPSGAAPASYSNASTLLAQFHVYL